MNNYRSSHLTRSMKVVAMERAVSSRSLILMTALKKNSMALKARWWNRITCSLCNKKIHTEISISLARLIPHRRQDPHSLIRGALTGKIGLAAGNWFLRLMWWRETCSCIRLWTRQRLKPWIIHLCESLVVEIKWYSSSISSLTLLMTWKRLRSPYFQLLKSW